MSAEATVLFPTLLSALRIGAHILGNRTLMGSMHTRLESPNRALDHRSECPGLAF